MTYKPVECLLTDVNNLRVGGWSTSIMRAKVRAGFPTCVVARYFVYDTEDARIVETAQEAGWYQDRSGYNYQLRPWEVRVVVFSRGFPRVSSFNARRALSSYLRGNVARVCPLLLYDIRDTETWDNTLKQTTGLGNCIPDV